MRRMIGIFLILVGMGGNFEGTRNQVIDGCSRGGGRRLCKEDVGWIVDLNNFLASLSLRSDMVGIRVLWNSWQSTIKPTGSGHRVKDLWVEGGHQSKV